MPELKNSSRVAPKATYVLRDTSKANRGPQNALQREPPVFAKAELVRGLRITETEARRLETRLSKDDRETLGKLMPMIEAHSIRSTSSKRSIKPQSRQHR